MGKICDRRLSVGVKRKVHETAFKQSIMYGLETAPLAKLKVTELKLLFFNESYEDG